MKKSKKIAILLSALILCGCNNSNVDETITDTDASLTETVTEAVTAEQEQAASGELPVMDGSTSATPLEIGLKAGKLGISFGEAKEMVSHTTTHDSFKRLISGEVDMIFSVPISEEQQMAADEAGVKLIMKPVAKEGFVFVVNGQNPVDSLTSQQIRDIYSGKITNWSQVGGNDLEILPYQRNTDSGSQNYMTVFMGDTPLSAPKTEMIAIGMGGLMDAVATYDNSEGAIGYSVYSYAAQMYANANKVKFIAVDGVKPSKNTMADESYPLLSSTYIIYTDKSPKSVEEFTDWALSDEGQKWVLESGYLPVSDMEIPDKYLAYDTLGTGEVMAEGTKPDMSYSVIFLSTDHGIVITDDGYYQIDCLKDKEFEKQINEDLKKALEQLLPNAEDRHVNRALGTVGDIILRYETRNGYISFILGEKNSDYYYAVYHRAVTLTYDLVGKKRIEHFSDLFYKDTDFVPLVNNGLSKMISQIFVPDTGVMQKIEFSGILGEPELFTISKVGFNADNPYFDCGPFLDFYHESFWGNNSLNESILDLSPLSRYRDMSDIFTGEASYSLYESSDPEWEEDYYEEEGVTYKKYVGSRFHTAEEVEKENEVISKVQHAGKDFLEECGLFGDTDDIHLIRLYKMNNDNFWVVHCNNVKADASAFIDAETYKPLTCKDLLGENWSNYLKEKKGEIEDYIPIYLSIVNGKTVEATVMNYRYLETMETLETISVPYSEVNHKYIQK